MSIITKNVDPATVPTPASGKTAFGTNLSSDVFIKDDTGAVTVITSGGTVTSVAVSSADSTVSVSGSPITTSGTIDLTVNEANLDLANIGGQANLATQVSGTLPIANGGTGQTTANAALNALLPTQTGNSGKVLTTDGTDTSWVAPGTVSPLTTKGDLYTYSTVNDRLPVGTNGQILAADSTEATGLKWIAPPATGVTSVDVSGGTTGLSFTGGPVTSSGTITAGGTLAITNGGTGATDAATALSNLGAYPASNPSGFTSNTGTVTSVDVASGGTYAAALSVSGGPVTTSGSITVTPNVFTSTDPGVVPASGGGTTNFLRADGTWAAAGGGGTPGGSDTQIQYNSSGSFAGSANFTWTDGTETLTIGEASLSYGAIADGLLIRAANQTDPVSGHKVQITGGASGGNNAANISVLGGSSASGGDFIAFGGTSSDARFGGELQLSGGSEGALSPGSSFVLLRTNNIDRFAIDAEGAWRLGGIAGSAGTSGQVLTSQGTGAAPIWSTPSGSGTVTSVDVSGGTTGLTFSGGPVTTSGTITMAGTLDEANGGTGQTTYATGDILYASAANTLSKLAAGTDGQVLTLASGVPSWAAGGGGGGGSVFYKDAVRVATTANGTFSTAFDDGSVIDGVTLATGDRILIKNQSTASQNGIYIVQASGDPVRASDFDTSGDEVSNGCIVPVQFGTVNGGSLWQLVQNGGTIGNSFRFAPVSGVAMQGQAAGTAPSATGTNALAIGNAATASGTDGIAIGTSTNTGTGSNICIGSGASSTNSSTSFPNICIGKGASAPSGNGSDIAIGNSAGSTNTGGANVQIGDSTKAYNGSVSIGTSASAGTNAFTTRCVAIGHSSQVLPASSRTIIGSIAVGREAVVGTVGSSINVEGSVALAYDARTNHNGVAIGRSARTDMHGQYTFTNGRFSTAGDIATGFVVAYQTTTDATVTEVGVAQGTATTTPAQRITLVNDSSYIFDCDIIARNTGDDTESKAWNLKFAIRRGTSAANTALIGSATKTVIGEDTGTSGWDVSATADTTNGRPNISVTGEASKTIRWVANIRMTKVTG